MLRHRHAGIAWLELLLGLAFLALLFQVFPSLGSALLSALDIRIWSRTTWFALNLLVLLGLFGIRFGSDLYADWKERRKRMDSSRRRQAAMGAGESHTDPDYETRVRRDADWRERARKRLPWHS